METVQNLMLGFSVALTPTNFLFALFGCFFGTMLGVLPGIGSTAGMAMLLPFTFNLSPDTAIIMLAAIYYGNSYGGTTSAILMNVPGEASNAVSCLEGYPMAKQGRAGVALAVAAVGSFIGGSVAILALILVAKPLTSVALQFGPVEFFALLVLGISLLTTLAGKSMIKGLMAGAFGLLVAMVGMDPALGSPRFTFGRIELMDGIGFIPVIMGLFGISEILENAENPWKSGIKSNVGSLFPTREDIRDSVVPVIRGSLFGVAIGLIPGMTLSASSFLSYAMEKKFSRRPELFGTGVIEGLAGPETANNAHANAALVPLFTLGLPGSASIALLMGGFMVHGLTPGPFLFSQRPDIAWGVIASMISGNVILLILNLPLIGMWVKILELPYSILFAIILGFMVLGSYSIDNSSADILIMLLFGIIGYLLRKLDFPMAPTVLTLVLGILMERSLRRSLEMSQGEWGIILESPIATVVLAGAGIVLLTPAVRMLLRGLSWARQAGAKS